MEPRSRCRRARTWRARDGNRLMWAPADLFQRWAAGRWAVSARSTPERCDLPFRKKAAKIGW